MEEIEGFLKYDKATPRGKKSSVVFSDFRYNKAKLHAESKPESVERIIELTKYFLKCLNMESENIICQNIKDIDYSKIKLEYGLNDERDIVWKKFTEDGYLGVVAMSNDINYDIPKQEEFRDLITLKKKHNSSGIIIQMLGKKWNEKFVLIFPLRSKDRKISRRDIECGVGNYLIFNNVPILDFYSHNY